MVIRKAVSADLDQILSIYNHSIIHTTSVYSYDARTKEWIEDWFKQKNNKAFPILIAEDQNQIVGFASYGQFRDWPAYLHTVEHSVHIHHLHQGKGIAKALMLELMKKAKEQKVHSMIGGVDADNEGSLLFHEKLGFERKAKLEQVGYKFNRWLDLVFVQIIL